MRRVAGLLLIAAVAVAGAASALASRSPRAVRRSIVRAALAQKSVHWKMSFSNLWSNTRVADVSADAAREHVTFDWGGPGGSRSAASARPNTRRAMSQVSRTTSD
jgi:hypothetical protein